jgi:hypothetical protein
VERSAPRLRSVGGAVQLAEPRVWPVVIVSDRQASSPAWACGSHRNGVSLSSSSRKRPMEDSAKAFCGAFPVRCNAIRPCGHQPTVGSRLTSARCHCRDDGLWVAVRDQQPIEFAGDPGAGDRRIGTRGQSLARAVVDYDQDAHAAAGNELIEGEVEGPKILISPVSRGVAVCLTAPSAMNL